MLNTLIPILKINRKLDRLFDKDRFFNYLSSLITLN